MTVFIHKANTNAMRTDKIWKATIEDWLFMACPDYWGELRKGAKFEKNGQVGLRLDAPNNNRTFFDALYDEIEVHPDHVYVRLGDNERRFYPDEGKDDGYGSGPHVFSENGKHGLKDSNGNVILPARYDVVHEWGDGDGADVIYVREGCEHHYFNHAGEEILKGVKPLMGYPRFLEQLVEEDPHGEMLCMEPIEGPETERDAYAFGRWVRFSSISCDTIREMFQKCEIVPVCEETYAKFTNEWTYSYSAAKAHAKGEGAIMKCVETIASFLAYSTDFMLKICVNHQTKIDPHDLCNAVFYYKDKRGVRHPVISIGYDDTLEDGEVSVLRVRSENWADIIPKDPYITDTLSKGTYEEVVDGWDKCEEKTLLNKYAFWELGNDFKRSWETTCRVADFIWSKGAGDVNDYLKRAADYDCFHASPKEYANKLKAMEWALRHGADVHRVLGGSYLSRAIKDKTEIGRLKKDEAERDQFFEWNYCKIALLKAHGALMPEEILEMIQERVEDLKLSEIVAL